MDSLNKHLQELINHIQISTEDKSTGKMSTTMLIRPKNGLLTSSHLMKYELLRLSIYDATKLISNKAYDVLLQIWEFGLNYYQKGNLQTPI